MTDGCVPVHCNILIVLTRTDMKVQYCFVCTALKQTHYILELKEKKNAEICVEQAMLDCAIFIFRNTKYSVHFVHAGKEVYKKVHETRIHSSRMHTARSLTVSRSMLKGVFPTPQIQTPPMQFLWTEGMTHVSENDTLPPNFVTVMN